LDTLSVGGCFDTSNFQGLVEFCQLPLVHIRTLPLLLQVIVEILEQLGVSETLAGTGFLLRLVCYQRSRWHLDPIS
jgi:hypothetical protein